MITASAAGFARRFAALIYDLFLVAALLIVYTFGALLFTRGHAILRDSAGWGWYLYCAGELGVATAYFVLNWIRSGQTLGMRAWQLRVVDPQGRPVRLGGAALRAAAAVLAWMPLGLGVLWMYLDSDRLALQDRLSATRVVRLTRT